MRRALGSRRCSSVLIECCCDGRAGDEAAEFDPVYSTCGVPMSAAAAAERLAAA